MSLPHPAIHTILGFDRVEFALDNPTLPDDVLADLQGMCAGGAEVISRALPFNPLYQAHLRLLQPDRNAFACLVDSLGVSISAVPTYCEVAIDLVVGRRSAATANEAWIAEHVSFVSLHARPHRHERTTYFGRRHDRSGNKRAVVPAMYSDKPSKLNSARSTGQPCTHLEIRFSGSPALQRIGLASVGDFASFDHEDFWRAHVELFMLPRTKSELGRAVGGPQGPSVSQQALYKRAKAFVDMADVRGQFYMHSAVRLVPHLRKRLARINVGELLGKKVTLI